LNNGNTWTCKAPHGLSLSDNELGNVDELAVAGRVSVEAEAVAEREAGRCPGRWDRVPKRCISRETSLESYVLPVVDYQCSE
jgi:hypothetical protein